MPHAYIFDAHLLMLEDPLLLDRAVGGRSATSTSTRSGRCARCPSSCTPSSTQFSDDYLRERSTDLDDVLGRIQLNLRGRGGRALASPRLPGRFVLVAGGPHARRRRPSSTGSACWRS